MRHFLFEFITGGGLSGLPLPESLISEGALMMQTLLKEISELDDAEITLCRDSRLALYDSHAQQHVIEQEDVEQLIGLIKDSEVCWLIAPETDSCLENYAKIFTKHGQVFIGSSIEAIRLTASKYLTNKILKENNIPVVETKRLNEVIPESDLGWVIKPDDGVGAEKTRIVLDKESLNETISNEDPKKMIVQPYLDGKHLSMSLLVFNNDVCLIGCNQQYIDIKDGMIKLTAIGVNECLMFKDDMLDLAKNIVAAIPGLAGYVGVDLIEVEQQLFVLEINPRFTTAYAGISESIGCNITAKVLDAFLNRKLPEITLNSATPVRINI
jgi:tyramine---L-glutamate ligase